METYALHLPASVNTNALSIIESDNLTTFIQDFYNDFTEESYYGSPVRPAPSWYPYAWERFSGQRIQEWHPQDLHGRYH